MAKSAFELISGRADTGWLVICDHARNHVPEEYNNLGLDAAFLARHIGWDIGAEDVTRALCAQLGCEGVMSTYSRLLIDPNRGEHDPTLIMRLSDGVIIPANRHVDDEERERRLASYHRPYHGAISDAIGRAMAAGKPPAIISIHSFTPEWKGVPRPWHYGILWDRDDRLSRPLIKALEESQPHPVGDNEPYSGQLKGDTLYRHGTMAGLAHALIEVRNDLIATRGNAEAVGAYLAKVIAPLSSTPGLSDIRHFGSNTF